VLQTIGVHKCNAQDYSKFYKTSYRFKKLIDDLKEQDALFCPDSLDINGLEINYKLFGRDEISTHRRFDIIFKPC
jgi:hypothetical protein